MGRERIWNADRFVLYLPVATKTLTDIDGSREKEIRNATKKFLSSPEATADKRPEDYVWQIRGLSTNTRAFATWCQNTAANAEAFVVLDIYEKSNEEDYWADIDTYNEHGEQYHRTFNSLAPEEFDDWVEQVSQREGIEVVRDD